MYVFVFDSKKTQPCVVLALAVYGEVCTVKLVFLGCTKQSSDLLQEVVPRKDWDKHGHFVGYYPKHFIPRLCFASVSWIKTIDDASEKILKWSQVNNFLRADGVVHAYPPRPPPPPEDILGRNLPPLPTHPQPLNNSSVGYGRVKHRPTTL